jgi:hypothetical protein
MIICANGFQKEVLMLYLSIGLTFFKELGFLLILNFKPADCSSKQSFLVYMPIAVCSGKHSSHLVIELVDKSYCSTIRFGSMY